MIAAVLPSLSIDDANSRSSVELLSSTVKLKDQYFTAAWRLLLILVRKQLAPVVINLRDFTAYKML